MANRWVVVLIVVTFVVLFLLLVLSLLRGSSIGGSTTSSSEPLTSPVGLGYRCMDYKCEEGLECDSVLQQCRRINGGRCIRASECLNGAYCSGICVTGEPGVYSGTAQAPCPCGETMECVDNPTVEGARYCLKKENQPCEFNLECLSSVCKSGRCAPGNPYGNSCSSNSQCVDGNCSLGYCQPPGLTTGAEGSICRTPGPPDCGGGMSCLQGRCRRVTQGLGELCDTTLLCIDPLVCYQNEGQFLCSSDSQACECGYNYNVQVDYSRPDPNGCNFKEQCSLGYTCVEGRCLGLGGTPCSRDNECLFECLEQGAGLYVLLFYALDSELAPTLVSTSPSLIIGSYDLQAVRISNGLVPPSVSGLTGYPIIPSGTGTQSSTSTAPTSVPSSSELASKVVLYYIVRGNMEDPGGTGLIDYRGVSKIKGWSSTTTVAGDLKTTDERLFIWAEVWSSTGAIIAFNQKLTYETSSGDVVLVNTVEGDVLYNYNPSTGALTPLNGDELQPGRQYNSDSTLLTISSFSRSYNGDIMIQDRSLRLYVRPVGTPNYFELPSSSGNVPLPPGLKSPKYYRGIGTESGSVVLSSPPCYGNCPSWLDVSYVSEIIDYNSQYRGELLQFNGNAEGASFVSFEGNVDTYRVENYSVYSDPLSGITGGYIAMVATNDNNGRTSLMVAPSGRLSVIPGYVNTTTQLLALENGLYLYSTGGCSS